MIIAELDFWYRYLFAIYLFSMPAKIVGQIWVSVRKGLRPASLEVACKVPYKFVEQIFVIMMICSEK